MLLPPRTFPQRQRRDLTMKRILLTGMSGTGKSSVIRELAGLGYKAIDADSDEWSGMGALRCDCGLAETA
jgi:energy-coupling factor transporter ATP-binding protein EcfA2